MKRIIVSSYQLLINLAVIVVMLAGLGLGYGMGNESGHAILGAVAGGVVAFILSVVIFGALYVLEDIRSAVRSIEAKQDRVA